MAIPRFSIQECIVAMEFRIIEQESFLKMLDRSIVFPQMRVADFQCHLSPHREPRVRQALRHAKKIPGDLERCAQLCSQNMECPEAPQDLGDFRSLA
jgi:hypothetical protein